ncbi:hypothetical protein [Secundilactobacillus folii]|uniref:S-layer protein n=1 Tax=Secundilactobacillus folii TaxID=2678357 RepID=A0A7X2XYI7_9LACO|nr:hypothetical protein [Secundilactobacillus folii]MTV82686.1 hypothetical protein [Secundilactobacillus folii]
MQASLKKSLYLGLAAVSFVAAAGAATTNASAKTYAKVTSNATLTTAATDRNVTLTGTNAVYTKAGTLKGAKVVASTTTAKKLSTSKNGSANFRAYRVATTNRGSVYYKVVSFDGAYRGWVYGGTSKTAFNGGVASYATTKDQTNNTSTFTLTGTTSATKNDLFYTSPAYAQYKVGRSKAVTSTSSYANEKLTFSATTQTSREGDTWYKVATVNGSTTDPAVGTWVKASNVKDDSALNADTQVKVDVKDVATGSVVTSFNYTTTSAKGSGSDVTGDVYANGSVSKGLQDATTTALKGKGYTVNPGDSVNALSNVKAGSTVTLYATKNTQKTSKVTAYVSYDGSIANTKTITAVSDTTEPSESAAQFKVIAPTNGETTLFAGTEGESFTADQALAFLNGSSYYKELKSPTFKGDGTDGTDATKTYQYVLTPASAKAGTFGTPFEAQYNATRVEVTTPSTSTGSTTNQGNPFA